MKLPLILQDIDNNVLGKTVIVNNGNFFIKSYKKFNIELFFDNEKETDPLDDPKIYSVFSNTDIRSGMEFYGIDVNYSYTIYLGKSPKELIIRITDFEFPDDEYFITLKYQPENVLSETEEHYNSLLVNNNLPSYEELKPAIIDENHQEVLKRLLLDFKEIIRYKGTIKSIEQFLYFIGFNPNSINILPEYITPTGIKTINPNKEVDIKTGYYHIIYDAFEWQEPKYNRKNLPNVKNAFTNFKEFFDKLLYALILANDYFTINEQQMSFFGTNNIVNVPKFISLTTQFTNIQKFDTLNFRNLIDIDIYNRTLIDSNKKDIVLNNVLVNKHLQLSEVKIFEGNHVKQNPMIYRIDMELTDNDNDTNLTDEQEMQIKYVFGNVLNISIGSNYSQVQYTIINTENELFQFKSNKYNLSINKLEHKIVIEQAGTYLLTFYIWDYRGNRFEYFYEIDLNTTNIDFDIFNSKNIMENENNKLNNNIDSPIITKDINVHNNLLIIGSDSNPELSIDLKNYFEITENFPTKNLYGLKQYKLPLLNHNIKMNDLTETLVTDYIDNFLNIISIRKLPDCTYTFNENELFVKLLDIEVPSNGTIEQHYFISTKENSININKFLHQINIVYNNIKYNIENILNNQLPEEFEFRTKILPVNFDFNLDKTNTEIYQIKSVFPRLQNIEDNHLDSHILKLGDLIVCNIDNKYIVNFTDVNWKIFNAFNGKLLKSTDEFTLKYRINEKSLYNILLTFKINGKQFQIDKKSIQTSFVI